MRTVRIWRSIGVWERWGVEESYPPWWALTYFPSPPYRTHEVTVLQLQAFEHRKGDCTKRSNLSRRLVGNFPPFGGRILSNLEKENLFSEEAKHWNI
ncbi:unnamed protein product [Leptosia nina]|uniref:Uncharacterized protein n=1 Tax=Leptosia nina TaxID=320188 RepID=A0AAV1JRE8_9NEOP